MSGGHIIRRTVAVLLLLMSVIGVLLGNPAGKIFWLFVGVAVVVWDVRLSKKPKHKPVVEAPKTKSHTSDDNYIVSDVFRHHKQSAPEVFSVRKRPVIILLFIIAVIAAYSIGYATGKNTAVRLSNEQTITAP